MCVCLCDVRLANGAPATAPNKEIWPARAWRVSPNSTMGLLSTVVAFLHSLKSPRQNEPGHASKSHANDCGDWCRHIMWWWWGGILHPSIHPSSGRQNCDHWWESDTAQTVGQPRLTLVSHCSLRQHPTDGTVNEFASIVLGTRTKRLR